MLRTEPYAAGRDSVAVSRSRIGSNPGMTEAGLKPVKEVAMTPPPDHELEASEDDQAVPPRPEEVIADAPLLG